MRRLVPLLLAFGVSPLTAQSPFASADSAISLGHPWRATELLAPLLAAPATRTPEVVILAARAAGAWEGWSSVRRLLEHETWLDTRFDRLGRRLLAEADLAEFKNPEAVVDARAAIVPDSGRAAEEQGKRLVLLARAYDRLDQLDSAAVTYQLAAALLPDLADWLALRTAGVTRDSAARASLYTGVALPAAVPRIPWTEALARDRSNDVDDAGMRYEHLGAIVAATRVRWRGALTDSVRRLAAARFVELMRPVTATTEWRDALDLIHQIDPPFSRDDRLVIARRAATVNRPQDAVDEFAIAAKDAPLSPADRVAYGTALGAVSRWTDAAEVFAGVTEPGYAGRAAYYHARALMRNGQQELAVPALRQVVRRFPTDTFAAATALHLLADLAVDAGDVDSARSDYLKLAARYPSSTLRSHAILLAALIALEAGKGATAARELSAALEAHLVTGEVDASHYWLARARMAMGDTTAARATWAELTLRGPESYYAVRAAARLDTVPWATLAREPLIPPDSLDGVFARALRLDQLGLDAEAKFERDRIAAEAKGLAGERVGEAFLARGFPSRATALAARANAAGAVRDAVLWQLMYPLPFATPLRETADREHVDPLLVASVIRQESGFEPHATSRTDARGLMQVEPATGRDLAQALGLPDFDPALLWVPPVNLALGIHHFVTGLARYPELIRGLAAYNAGTTRVDRWSTSPLNGKDRATEHARDPLDDVDIFVERIPFVETRDYVRAIVRNQAVYRMVYGAQ
jgi:soluble lytic murein transglycosylase-like protein